MSKTKFMLTLFAVLFSIISCRSPSDSLKSNKTLTNPELISKKNDEVSLMTFNVENLFDTEHDANKEDFTYLPLSLKKNSTEVQNFCKTQKPHYQSECFSMDWSPEVLKTKFKKIGQVIKSVDHGQGPDNLFLIEVENENVLRLLVKNELSQLGYQTIVLIEGPDERGIDPGFISKFPLSGKPQLHIIPFKDLNEGESKTAKKTRGILEVSVLGPNKKEFTFLIGHFPSQASPTKLRQQALEYATELMKGLAAKGKIVIFGGDLNVTDEEDHQNSLFANTLETVSFVSHKIDCKDCEGSHFYRGRWSFLDILAIHKENAKNGWELVPNSVQVVKTAEHTKPNGTPLRFNVEEQLGVSDHFPLYLRLRPHTEK